MIDLIKSLFPLVGVALGWMLAQLTEKFKASREDKRKLKRTLFYLLEVRHQLSFYVGIEEFTTKYVAVIKEKYKHLDDIKHFDEKTASDLLSEIIQRIISEKPLAPPQDIDDLNRSFKTCIDHLSEVDPLLAFRLHGKQSIRQTLQELIDRSKVTISKLTDNVTDVENLTAIFQFLEPNVLKDSLVDLDLILIEIANKINKATAKETQNRISAQKTPIGNKEMEGLVEKLLEGIPGFPTA